MAKNHGRLPTLSFVEKLLNGGCGKFNQRIKPKLPKGTRTERAKLDAFKKLAQTCKRTFAVENQGAGGEKSEEVVSMTFDRHIIASVSRPANCDNRREVNRSDSPMICLSLAAALYSFKRSRVNCDHLLEFAKFHSALNCQLRVVLKFFVN